MAGPERGIPGTCIVAASSLNRRRLVSASSSPGRCLVVASCRRFSWSLGFQSPSCFKARVLAPVLLADLLAILLIVAHCLTLSSSHLTLPLPPALHRHPRVVALVPSASTPDPELVEADSVSALDLKFAEARRRLKVTVLRTASAHPGSRMDGSNNNTTPTENNGQ
ncbi:hypothetical protein PIB30_064223 [Stylosanthes scabra]|uniref:Uncharacterized protein n=1 Tax=Stylosanthes scabra TaxID=79078 RepID=A0ABU6ZKC4_9FABA|nr:hypothetical protein [Stylosanthes scabra]